MQWAPCPECQGPVYRTRGFPDSRHSRACLTRPSWDDLFDSYEDRSIDDAPCPAFPDPKARTETPFRHCNWCQARLVDAISIARGVCASCDRGPRAIPLHLIDTRPAQPVDFNAYRALYLDPPKE